MQTFKRYLKLLTVTVKTLSATRQNTSLNVLNGYESENVPSTLKLTMISDENGNQFLIFLIVIYLIDPDFITLYRKKNFEILTNFTRTRF